MARLEVLQDIGEFAFGGRFVHLQNAFHDAPGPADLATLGVDRDVERSNDDPRGIRLKAQGPMHDEIEQTAPQFRRNSPAQETIRPALIVDPFRCAFSVISCIAQQANWNARTDSAPWFRLTRSLIKPSKQLPSLLDPIGNPRSLAP